MPVSTSARAFDDCFDLFERALASKKGIRKEVPDLGMARNLVMRMHKARLIHRQEMTALPEDHPNHGVSPYDAYVVRFREDDSGCWVYIEPRAIDGEIQELGAAE